MTDIEITKLCAEAMGWKHLGAVGILPLPGENKGDYANRADKLNLPWCYSNQNDWWVDPEGRRVCGPCEMNLDPLHDDAQAMALVKKLQLSIAEPRAGCGWGVYRHDALRQQTSEHADLNRAICLCVASMEKAK